jgi:hypothetical protein
MYDALVFRIICPHHLSDGLHAPNIQIESFENMLELGQLDRGQRKHAWVKDTNAHL